VAPGLTVHRMAAHRAAWADLAARALEPSVFNDPGFGLPAAWHLAGPRAPRFLLAWDPQATDRLIGLCCIAPPVPGLPLSAWLHSQATGAFPLLDGERAAEALAALLAMTRRRPAPAGLLLHGLPDGGPTQRLLAASPWPVARLAERSRAVVRPGDALGVGRGAKEMRRQARRLADQGHVAYVSATSAAAVADALPGFLDLEGRGWKGRRGSALGQSPRLRRFVTEMTAALAAGGGCRIDRLDLDGRTMAGGLVLRNGATAFYWKTAYDERYARFSPGAHLAEAIGRRQLADPSVTLTDSCAVPGHTMIDRVWPGRMSVSDMLVGPVPSRALHLAAAVERVRRDLRSQAKRLLAARFRPRP
jgi:CelD/BcsL family acetyltransferase involved in cellulose biosynthesis